MATEQALRASSASASVSRSAVVRQPCVAALDQLAQQVGRRSEGQALRDGRRRGDGRDLLRARAPEPSLLADGDVDAVRAHVADAVGIQRSLMGQHGLGHPCPEHGEHELVVLTDRVLRNR